jgi:hypothetical protein
VKRVYILIVIASLLVGAAPYQPGVGAESLTAKRFSISRVAGTPSISYAEWIGKNLRVEGEDFSDGATVFVDGERLKSLNDENYPSVFVYAKKAKKKITPNQVIKVQVQNTDGATSNEFTFYSGFVITRSYSGSWVNLRAGERFLLYLPSPLTDPPSFTWSVSVYGGDPTILIRNTDDLPIPGAQGFFQGAGSGRILINAQGSYLCPPLPPQYCLTGIYIGFDLGVIVE